MFRRRGIVKNALRMVHDDAVKGLIRKAHAGESFLSAFEAGSLKDPNVVDEKLPDALSSMIPEHRVRPSILLGPLQAMGFVLGASSSLLPFAVNERLRSAVSEALAETYNDGIRDIYTKEDCGAVKEKFKERRDFYETIGSSEEKANANAICERAESVFKTITRSAIGLTQKF